MRKSFRYLMMAGLLSLVLPFAAFAEEVKVTGGTAGTAKVKAEKAVIEKATGATLNILPMGVEAIVELVNGRGNIVVGTYSEKAIAEALEKAGLGAKVADVKKVGTFADEIAVIVNSANPVSALTKDQVKGIFTGTIENWKDVGGKDTFVTIAITRLGKGVNAIFSKEMLDGGQFFKDSVVVDAFSNVVTTVGSTPDAIAHIPASESISGPVKVINTPKTKLVYNIYVAGDGQSPAVKSVIAELNKLK